MKIAVFTHKRDIDGMGGAILSKLITDQVDIFYCDYSDFLTQLTEFVKEKNLNEYDKIFILDLSIGESSGIVELIEANNTLKERILLFDHHDKSLHLNNYDWGNVFICDNLTQEKTCATSLFYKYLLEENLLEDSEYLKDFVNDIRLYDTWQWVQELYNIRPKQLTFLFEIYGIEKFVSYFSEMLLNGNYQFSDTDYCLIELKEKEIKDYVLEKATTVTPKVLQGYNCAIVFAELYRNEIAEYLKSNIEYDIIIIIGDSISFRTGKDNVDLSVFASKYGGGGSKKTAGATISTEIRNEMIALFFKE